MTAATASIATPPLRPVRDLSQQDGLSRHDVGHQAPSGSRSAFRVACRDAARAIGTPPSGQRVQKEPPGRDAGDEILGIEERRDLDNVDPDNPVATRYSVYQRRDLLEQKPSRRRSHHVAGRSDFLAAGTAGSSEPYLRHAGVVGLACRPPQRAAVTASYAANLFTSVQMCVDVANVYGFSQHVHRVQHGNRHTMVPAEHEHLRAIAP